MEADFDWLGEQLPTAQDKKFAPFASDETNGNKGLTTSHIVYIYIGQ
jgi:hypothetical protein